MGYIRDLTGLINKDGKTIKPNMLIRSAQLYRLKQSQIDYLKSINIKRIIDLRNYQETLDEPDYEFENVHYFNYSLIDSNLNGITHEKKSKQLSMLKQMPTMIETYIDMFKDEYSLSQIKKSVREIVLNDEYPTIIHCVTGKDRAGMITMILLYILNFDYEVIFDDYLKQRKYYINKARFLYLITYIASRDKKTALKAYDYYAVRKKYIEAVLKTIDEKFGSMDNFIYNFIELTDKDIKHFKETVLI